MRKPTAPRDLVMLLCCLFVSCLSPGSRLAAADPLDEPWVCPGPDGARAALLWANQAAPRLPATGQIKALIVFVRFADDTGDTMAGQPIDCYAHGWSSETYGDTLPRMFTDSLLSPVTRDVDSTFVEGSITDYFERMSRGHLWVYGDVFNSRYYDTLVVVPDSTAAWYDENEKTFADVNHDVLEKIDPLVDFNEYDTWPDSTGGDGVVDFVAIVYRQVPWIDLDGNGRPFTCEFIPTDSSCSYGRERLGCDFRTDNIYSITGGETTFVRIDGDWPIGDGGSGTTFHTRTALNRSLVQIVFCHEFGHYLFSNEMLFGRDTHLQAVCQYGLMAGGWNLMGNAMSGYEKWRLGWIEPDTLSGDTTVTVRDASSTGDLFLVEPGSIWNDARDDSLYFLIENRERVTMYDQDESDKYGLECVDYFLPSTGILVTQGSYAFGGAPFDTCLVDVESAYGSYDTVAVEYPPYYKSDEPDPFTGYDGLDSLIYGRGGWIDRLKPVHTYGPGQVGGVFSPYSNPSSDEWDLSADPDSQRVKTGVGLLNFRYADSESVSVKVDVFVDLPDSQINVNTAWSGRVILNRDLTVTVGDTLRVLPGTEVMFKNNADGARGGVDSLLSELIVEGTLLAQNRGADSLVFMPDTVNAQEKGDWYGIRLERGGAAVLDSVGVRDAYVGVDARSPDTLAVLGSTIMANRLCGIRLRADPVDPESGTSSLIRDNVIVDNAYDELDSIGYGIYVSAQSPTIERNTIHSNKQYDVYLYAPGTRSASVVMKGNHIGSDALEVQYGVHAAKAGQLGSLSLFSRDDVIEKSRIDGKGVYVSRAGNLSLVQDSLRYHRHALYVYATDGNLDSTRFEDQLRAAGDSVEYVLAEASAPGFCLGDTTRSPSSRGRGYNSFEQISGGAAVRSYVRSYDADTLKAEQCWWGSSGGPDSQKMRGPIDWIPYLDSEPSLTLPLPLGSPPTEEEGALSTLLAALPNPFVSLARIRFVAPADTRGVLHLRVYDLQGRLVRDLLPGPRKSGVHEVIWDATDGGGSKVQPGVYFVEFGNEAFKKVCKIVLVR